MSYVSNADIQQRLGTAAYIQLTDDDGTGSADESVVDEARISAEAEIDSHLAGRYATPVDATGEPAVAAVLASMALDLASYRLHLRRVPVPADVIRRREESMAWLRAVAAGQAHLPALTPPTAARAQGIVAQIAGPQRRMTREALEGL